MIWKETFDYKNKKLSWLNYLFMCDRIKINMRKTCKKLLLK